MRFVGPALRIGIAAALVVSGLSHAYLYVHGYHHIPNIGPAFLLQATLSLAVGVLLAVGGPGWLRWTGAALSAGSLVAFVLSRTVGVLGFTEVGWQPAPHAVISVIAEVVTVGLWAVWLAFTTRRVIPR